jgi:predicted ATPase/DNA-binding SARP family transcriptional activator
MDVSQLELRLFGSPSLASDGVPVRLHSRKCMALLAYLAVTGTSHSRETLATLFWPETDTSRARAALRSTLSRLKNALGGAWLVVDRDIVGFDGSQEGAVDVVQFRHLLTQCQDHGHPAGETCSGCLPLLIEAVGLCHGDFLAGFGLHDSPLFDDWQSRETQALRLEAAAALELLAEGWAARGDVGRGISAAQRWLALDSLNEAAHRCLMRLYAGSGQRAAAMRQYSACERLLREELAVSPSRQTVALAGAIREGWTPQLHRAPAAPHSLPPQPTPFVGRVEQLAQIAQLLAEPECRLLSVLGPGGIGKTRLAIRAAEEQSRCFAGGVLFVPLVDLDPPDLLPSAILDALSVPLASGLHPKDQLVNALRERQLLLVLDSFEHLLGACSLLAELLRQAPGIKLLVTSRRRLNLRDEWLFPLGGMQAPGDAEIEKARAEEAANVWGVASEESAAHLEGYSAVQLFVQCARRVRPEFSLASPGASWVGRICRLVEGMPLAIELAAAWMRLLSGQEIAEEIQQGLDTLSTSLRDVPQRHRSMRAVCDHSWRLLADEEKDVLPQLSVFRGGFRREAAEAVAGASLEVLSALADSSWLRVTPPGRYDMHELVRQYAGERLDTGASGRGARDGEQVRDRHSHYYAAFLHSRELRLLGRGQKEALQEILEEIGNVWAAWNWALARGQVGAVAQCVVPLEEIAEMRGWHQEANQAFDKAAAMLRQRLAVAEGSRCLPENRQTKIVLAQVLRSQALESWKLGGMDRARALCEESLALLSDVEPDPEQKAAIARVKGFLGWVLHASGLPSKGDEVLREALPLYEELHDSRGRAATLMLLSSTPHHLGRYEEAESLLQKATALADEAGDERYKAWCLANLSEVLCDRGEYQRARMAAEEACRIRQHIGDRAGTAHSLLKLGDIAAALGNYETAREYYQQALALAKEVGDPVHGCSALQGLGAVAAATGSHAEASEWFEKSLAIAKRTGIGLIRALAGLGNAACGLGEVERSTQYFTDALREAMRVNKLLEAADVLVGLAHLQCSQGNLERAAQLLTLALRHPATSRATGERAQRLLSELTPKLSPELLSRGTEWGQAREWEAAVEEILGATL